ncbi:MAG: disulfide bond formation protein B [Rhodobiaceae bacterium]|nr:disulfide bond formation protein B [Rhodobiaceae bacterium]MCC0019327.1 disulfide bond formation protein B [Rhodobiaceae bacterium]
MTATRHWRIRPWRPSAVLAVAVALAVILGAWGFQLIGGLPPCHLCLIERIPYYAGIPLALAGIGVSYTALPAAPLLTRIFIGLFVLAMLISAGLGGYHAGVEWGWWAGPTTCTGTGTPGTGTVGDLIDQLGSASVVRCNEAPIWILGLSLAGWNVVASLIAAWLAARAWARIPAA